jgi:hypothetical protein
MSSLRARGRRIAIGTGAAAALVVAGALIASKDLLLEEWAFHRLKRGDEEKLHAAAKRLAERGIPRTLRRLFESFEEPGKRLEGGEKAPVTVIYSDLRDADVDFMVTWMEDLGDSEKIVSRKSQLLTIARLETQKEIKRSLLLLNCIGTLERRLGPAAVPALQAVSRNESLPKPVRDLAAHDLEALLKEGTERS